MATIIHKCQHGVIEKVESDERHTCVNSEPVGDIMPEELGGQ